MKKIGILMLLAAADLFTLQAQTSASRLVGKVSDASGSYVQGATVLVTNDKTGQVRTTTSNSDGLYAVPQLEPSVFTITVSHAGFADSRLSGLKLSVGQEVVQNITLQIGAVASSVTHHTVPFGYRRQDG